MRLSDKRGSVVCLGVASATPRRDGRGVVTGGGKMEGRWRDVRGSVNIEKEIKRKSEGKEQPLNLISK